MMVKAARINGLEVSICGVGELTNFATHGVTHVISIWDGYQAENPEPYFRVNAVFPKVRHYFGYFNDVTHRFCGNFPPSQAVIEGIFQFTKGLKEGDYLLVHCQVGVSRSAAIAFGVLCQHAGPGLEPECFRSIRQVRPSANANPLIVELADQFLDRNGAMVTQLQSRQS